MTTSNRVDRIRLDYDVNTNTNYNSRAESFADVSGMGRLADFPGDLRAASDAARNASNVNR